MLYMELRAAAWSLARVAGWLFFVMQAQVPTRTRMPTQSPQMPPSVNCT
jgi:hypothetical protein